MPVRGRNERTESVERGRSPSGRKGRSRAERSVEDGRDSDLQLVALLLEGDEDAFQALVEKYHGRLIRLARQFLSDPASAEEIVQDTWVAVLRGLPGFEGRSALTTWIYQILSNRAKTRAIRDGRTVLFADFDSVGDGSGPAVDPARFSAGGRWTEPPRRWERDDPESLLLRTETGRIIEEMISSLPAGQRAVVTLRDIEGLSSDDVCNILDISETNQRVLLHRARSRLRRDLEEHLHRR
jgi:RNA polymerase sigma-70 factor (ECF subfamily)